MARVSLEVSLIVAFGVLSAACGGGNAASLLVKPPEYNPANQTKCGVHKSQLRPLIVEWPSADRSELEALAKRGPIFVRYSGCEMEVLSGCSAKGTYGWVPTTIQHDKITMSDSDELYANLPVGAAKLEGRIERGGQLTVEMTIIGMYRADAAVKRDDMQGTCDKATHVVRAMSVGAFDFYQEGSAEVGASVALVGGAKSAARRESLNQAGESAQCGQTTQTSTAPPDACGALLRVELEPIAAVSAPGTFTPHTVEGPSTDARVKVAVGCGDQTVRGPDSGLGAYLDGSSEALTPVVVRKRWSDQDAKEVVDYVSYPVPPGHHSLRVRVAECDSLETAFDVDVDHPATLEGVLPPASKAMSSGPAGSPDGLRLAVGGWGAQTQYADYYSLMAGTANAKALGAPVAANVGVTGPALSGGYVSRWWTAQADARLGWGSTSGSQYGVTYQAPNSSQPAIGPVAGDAQVFAVYGAARAGGRVPFSIAAVSAGPGIGLLDQSFKFTAGGSQSAVGVLLPIWAQLEVAPLCDWNVTAYGAYDAALSTGEGQRGTLSMVFTAAYQPDTSCRRERSGMYELSRRPE